MSVPALLLIGVCGAIAMLLASRIAIRHVIALSEVLRVPPFLVGITLVALGTDLPEIVNSVVSSALGHGDINVGDSIGSVFAQGTLVLGLVPFVARAPAPVSRRDVGLLCMLTVFALLLGGWLLRDGFIARLDAAGLLLFWAAATAIAWRSRAIAPESDAPSAARAGAVRHALTTAAALTVVAVGASGLVYAVAGISAHLAIPVFIVSFFGAALGTSMPELVVNLTAIRKGQREVALGGILGACLLDASISMAAGPLWFPTSVTAALAARGFAFSLAAMLVAGLLLAIRGKHDRLSGAVLVAVYFGAYFFQ